MALKEIESDYCFGKYIQRVFWSEVDWSKVPVGIFSQSAVFASKAVGGVGYEWHYERVCHAFQVK